MLISYQSENFPVGGPVTNGPAQLTVTWDDILWAALTVGRPNRAAVFQHGNASLYEAIFRTSLVRMALEQSTPTATRLRRTDAARTLDPSEKGAVNYFVGMAMCKLFADKVLGAPWMLHLDVFRPALNPVLTGRSRPDLVGERTTGDWIALESKGRISEPDATAKANAKAQAQRCVSIRGVNVQLHIGAVAYLRSDVLQFFWRDPPPDRENARTISINPIQGMWRYHYHLALALTRELGNPGLEDQLGVSVKVHPEVLKLVIEQRWDDAKAWCGQNADRLRREEFRLDGLRVATTQLWSARFNEGLGEPAEQ